MKDTHRTLVATALVLGAAAPIARTPYASQRGTIDIAALARLVATQRDHVDALTLGEWIRDRRPGLRVIDLRSADAFNALHIPTADNVRIEDLASLTLREDDTVVLYGEGGAHAGQAWVFLHALGHPRVLFLASGIHEWMSEVMEPRLATDATDAERARFDTASELSRYFGGTPVRGVARSAIENRTRDLRRRGC